VGSVSSEDTLGKGMVQGQGGTAQEGMRFHHTTQNGAQFRTHELLTSGVFHLIFWAEIKYRSQKLWKATMQVWTWWVGGFYPTNTAIPPLFLLPPSLLTLPQQLLRSGHGAHWEGTGCDSWR
jgi:hypothetical protein